MQIDLKALQKYTGGKRPEIAVNVQTIKEAREYLEIAKEYYARNINLDYKESLWSDYQERTIYLMRDKNVLYSSLDAISDKRYFSCVTFDEFLQDITIPEIDTESFSAMLLED